MMPTEYDVEREVGFNREKLGTAIPERLQELNDVIDGCMGRLEGWYATVFIKILQSVSRVCQDLVKTTEEEALPAAAWNARNLLELWVWTTHCSASRENARRFYEDALRDMLGLTDSLSKMCVIRGVPSEFDALAREKIKDVALAELGVNSLDPSYTRVTEAARSVGLDRLYLPCNTLLSKFAHPTAGLVVGIMHQTERLRDLQSVCTTFGVYFAGQCVLALERMVSAIPSA